MTLPIILFRDQRFVVIDKPAGLPAHPGSAGGANGGASVEDWFPLLSRRKDGPWLAHRLDADTSGCLVIALRKAPLIQAQAAFAEGRARKTYWAVVRGEPRAKPLADHGTVEANLARREANGQWRIEVDPAGQSAITDWRVLGRAKGLAWLELRPRTGRTHQIRVHCAHLGWPILGDARYGGGRDGGAMHLLARAIELPLDPPVIAVAEPAAAHRPALMHFGWVDGIHRKIL